MVELPPIIRNSARIPMFSSLLECLEYFSDIHFKRAFVMALDYTAHWQFNLLRYLWNKKLRNKCVLGIPVELQG